MSSNGFIVLAVLFLLYGILRSKYVRAYLVSIPIADANAKKERQLDDRNQITKILREHFGDFVSVDSMFGQILLLFPLKEIDGQPDLADGQQVIKKILCIFSEAGLKLGSPVVIIGKHKTPSTYAGEIEAIRVGIDGSTLKRVDCSDPNGIDLQKVAREFRIHSSLQ